MPATREQLHGRDHVHRHADPRRVAWESKTLPIAHHWIFVDQPGARGAVTVIHDITKPGPLAGYLFEQTPGEYHNTTDHPDGISHLANPADFSSQALDYIQPTDVPAGFHFPTDEPDWARRQIHQELVSGAYPNSPFSSLGGAPKNEATVPLADLDLLDDPDCRGFSVFMAGVSGGGAYHNNRFGSLPPELTIQYNENVLACNAWDGAGNPMGWTLGKKLLGFDSIGGAIVPFCLTFGRPPSLGGDLVITTEGEEVPSNVGWTWAKGPDAFHVIDYDWAGTVAIPISAGGTGGVYDEGEVVKGVGKWANYFYRCRADGTDIDVNWITDLDAWDHYWPDPLPSESIWLIAGALRKSVWEYELAHWGVPTFGLEGMRIGYRDVNPFADDKPDPWNGTYSDVAVWYQPLFYQPHQAWPPPGPGLP